MYQEYGITRLAIIPAPTACALRRGGARVCLQIAGVGGCWRQRSARIRISLASPMSRACKAASRKQEPLSRNCSAFHTGLSQVIRGTVTIKGERRRTSLSTPKRVPSEVGRAIAPRADESQERMITWLPKMMALREAPARVHVRITPAMLRVSEEPRALKRSGTPSRGA